MLAPSLPTVRKSSRLSHISSFRLHLLRPEVPTTFNNDVHSVSSVPSHALDNSDVTSHATIRDENYRLTKLNSQTSLGSDFSTQTQYRVQLELTAKEISLLRYTWNRMLAEETTYDQKPAYPMPGSMWSSSKDKPLPTLSSRQSLGALSTFCTQLYLNLLSMDPDLEKAFPSLKHQATSMAGVMLLAINSLDNLASLDDYLMELGKRHSRILGIEPAQFEMMGEALIQTFTQRFGTRFNNELEILWIKFYLYLANSIIQFGLDPVLRMDAEVYGRNTLYTESVFSTNTDTTSLMDASRRRSTSTAMTSVASVKPPLDAPKQASGRKKKRFGKKGDCVIV
ncbi:CIC11C00000002639 [Sungouiella intermedia]|uniref:CIC11C00000002639 n=1 Tax=Sungouiella intermedia TaxID=45354 RepID=A0A1L0C656_9ASCO|nr:CIC11C00000002639 [[Candida] intermedia]